MGKRILSAIMMLLIFIPIFMIGGNLYNFCIYVVSLIGLSEFISIKNSKKKVPFVIKILCFIAFSFLIFSNISGSVMIFSIDYRILSGIFTLFLIPALIYHDRSLYSINDAFYLIGGVLFLGISFSLMIVVRNMDLNILVYLFLIAIFSDTYAYITGSLIGNRKLLKEVSPTKTIEGLIGGIVFGTFVPTMYYTTVIDPQFDLLLLVFITMFLSVLGHLGDLCFSLIKRYFDKKDFSNLIPGHGGILDRFDSIIFILLGFMYFINIIGG